jgi:hypothetical protein
MNSLARQNGVLLKGLSAKIEAAFQPIMIFSCVDFVQLQLLLVKGEDFFQSGLRLFPAGF